MPYIRKADRNSVCRMYLLSISAAAEQLHRSVRIGHIVKRNILFSAGTPCLSIPPFRLEHLNVSAVTEHYLTQISCSLGRKNSAPEALLIEKRQQAGMINMSMGQKYKINIRCGHRYLPILIVIRSLLHTIVDKHHLAASLKHMAASCHLMGRP